MKLRPLFCLFVFAIVISGILHVSTRALGVRKTPKNRVVARLAKEPNEPVRIRAVRVKNARVSHRQKFLAEDDWLHDFSVTIMNSTSKNIVFAQVDVQFPRPLGLEGPVAIHTLEYGNREWLTRKVQLDETTARIVPGQSVDVAFIPNDVDRLASLLKDTGYQTGSPEKVHLSVGHIIFEDDSMWYAGSKVLRDPNVPGVWINAEILAQNKPIQLGPVRYPSSARTSDHELTNRWSLSTLDRSPDIKSFLVPASYTSSQTCKEFLATSYPGCGTSGWCGAECRYFQDSLTTSSGNYFLGAGSALCTRAACINESGEPSCNTYRSTYVKNTCGSGGGGGGGGGIGGGSEGCGSDWDCDFGSYCDWDGTCKDMFIF